MRFLDEELRLDGWTYFNSTTGEFELTPLRSWTVLTLLITSLIIIFTVCGNGMTLYAVCKMKSFQNSISNLYIASLAAADLIVGAFVMTLMMLHTIVYDGVWPFGTAMCDAWQAVDLISCTISLYSICAIGFDRWMNLERPLRVFKRNRLTARRALAFVWIAPLITWIPLMIGIRLKYGPSTPGTCTFFWRPTYMVPLVAAVLFYVPVFTLVVLFVRISLVIRSHLLFLHKHSNQNTSTSIFDLDRSPGASSPYGSTPASSRRRSAHSPVPGSLVNLKYAGTGGNSNLANGLSSRLQKFKPPPLSPIISVNVTAAMNSSSKDGAKFFDSSDVTGHVRPPNQSPLAMKVLRDRLSPKNGQNKCGCEKQQDDPTVFDFPLGDKSKVKGPNETTPLLAATSTEQGASESHKISQSKLTLLTTADMEGKVDSNFQSPHQIRRSISPDDAEIGNLARTASTKRSSVTSDTAVFFTKRFLTHKPPLLRAKTEVVLETNRRRPRPSARFSIIPMAFPLFSRKYSMNIFSDMFPHGAGSIGQQIRAAKAVGIIMIFFLVSWTPFLVLWPLKALCPDCVSDRLYHLSIWANYLNSTINPVLYTLCSPRFQRVFRKHCSRCPCVRKKRNNVRVVRKPR